MISLVASSCTCKTAGSFKDVGCIACIDHQVVSLIVWFEDYPQSMQSCNLSFHTCACRQRQGFVTMVSYGEDYEKQGRKPVRLLYRGGNHYDLLLD